MSVLFSWSFIRNGHFAWCENRSLLRSSDHECQVCRFQLYVFATNLSFVMALIEFWGGWHTGSASLWSDAWHVVSDSLGYGIGGGYAYLAMSRRVEKTRLKQLRQQVEFVLGVLLVLAAMSIFSDVVGRLWFHHVPKIYETETLLLVAGAGFGVNVCILILLHSFGAGHSHAGHKHDHAPPRDRILQANMWHTFGDAASSVLVIVNALILSMSSNPLWGYLDLAIAALIAGTLLYQGISILAGD